MMYHRRPPMTPSQTKAETALLFALTAKLAEDGRAELVCFGTSMMPLVWPGTRIELERVPAQALRAGDLVLYRRAGEAVLHRVLQRRRTDLRVGGDALSAVESVPFDAVLGRARGAVLFRWQLAEAPRLGAALGRLAPSAGWLYRKRRVLGPLHRLTGAAFRILR